MKTRKPLDSMAMCLFENMMKNIVSFCIIIKSMFGKIAIGVNGF